MRLPQRRFVQAGLGRGRLVGFATAPLLVFLVTVRASRRRLAVFAIFARFPVFAVSGRRVEGGLFGSRFSSGLGHHLLLGCGGRGGFLRGGGGRGTIGLFVAFDA